MNELKNCFLLSFIALFLVVVIIFETNFNNPTNDAATVLIDQSFKFELERLASENEIIRSEGRSIVLESADASILPSIDGTLELILSGLSNNSKISTIYQNSRHLREYSLLSDFFSSWGEIFPSGAKTRISFVDSLNKRRNSEVTIWTADLDTDSLEVSFRVSFSRDYEENVTKGIISPIKIPSQMRLVRISTSQAWQIPTE